VGAAAGKMDAPAAQLDDEENVFALEGGRLDGEEVDRDLTGRRAFSREF
jgi:hypothetical protein